VQHVCEQFDAVDQARGPVTGVDRVADGRDRRRQIGQRVRERRPTSGAAS
jgi:hypothetical protein